MQTGPNGPQYENLLEGGVMPVYKDLPWLQREGGILTEMRRIFSHGKIN